MHYAFLFAKLGRNSNTVQSELSPIAQWKEFGPSPVTVLRHQCSSLGADLFRANIISNPSCACGCPLEDAIHYLLECPLYTNARMQLIMSITPYTVISIENLLFGSDNLTDENNLIVFRNVQKYIHHSDLNDTKL